MATIIHSHQSMDDIPTPKSQSLMRYMCWLGQWPPILTALFITLAISCCSIKQSSKKEQFFTITTTKTTCSMP
jgi:hypothetical protein